MRTRAMMFGSRFGGPFAKLWGTSTITALADGTRLATLPLLATTMTHDPLRVGALTAVATAPWILAGLVAGAVVDRADRRGVLVFATAIRAAIVLGLAVSVAFDVKSYALLIALAFGLGVGDAFAGNASVSLIPAVVADSGDLEQANGLISVGYTVTNEFVGPPLGAVLFSIAAVSAFGVDGALLAAAAILATLLPRAGANLDGDGDTQGMLSSIGEGLRWITRDAPMRSTTFGLAALSFSDAAWFAILVLYVTQGLHLAQGAFGILLAVGAVGSVVGGLLAARTVARLGTGRSLSLMLLVAGGAQLAMGLVRSAPLAAVMIAICGLTFTVWNVAGASFRQRRVPNRLLGRVTAAYLLTAHGSTALGAICGGLAAQRFGLAAPFFLGVPFLIIAALLLASVLGVEDSEINVVGEV